MPLDKERIALIEFLLIIFLIVATIIVLITMDLHSVWWIILIFLLPAVIIPLSIILHELSHIIVMNYYTTIQITKLTREQELRKQPLGKVLLAGYIGELIFSINLIIIGLIALLINETPYRVLGIMLLLLAVIVILQINRARVSDKGDIYNYDKIKTALLKGCSCGSNEFKATNEIICAKCGKVIHKFKRIKGTVSTLHLNPYYLFGKKKKEIVFKFATDAPLKELFNLLSNPIPKKYWKEFDIENVIAKSETQYTTIYRDTGEETVRIIEKEYPSKLVSHITLELGFEVKVIKEFYQRQGRVEVITNATGSDELLELPVRRSAKKLYKRLIQDYLSKELGKKFKYDFY